MRLSHADILAERARASAAITRMSSTPASQNGKTDAAFNGAKLTLEEVLEDDGAAPIPPQFPWRTADEFLNMVEELVPWIWDGFIAMGTVTELDAKVKAGKTELVAHAVRAITRGETFLDRSTRKGPVIWVTEEGSRTIRAVLQRAHVSGRDVHIVSKREMLHRPTWHQIVKEAERKAVEVGAVLMVVDTFSKVAGLQGDDEQSSGQMMAAMLPLQELSSRLNLAILISRHDRKAGGEVGDSGRGSSAISGDVDTILQLSRLGGKGQDNRRILRAISRLGETPGLTIELVDDKYKVITETASLDAAKAAIMGMLPEDEGDAIAAVDVRAALKDAGHTFTTVKRAVAELLTAGFIKGDKVKGPSGHKRQVLWINQSKAVE
jgi:hypothetical protein